MFGRVWTGLMWINIWIDLIENRDQQREIVKSVMNLLVPQNARNF
jgi:hypothetical protein